MSEEGANEDRNESTRRIKRVKEKRQTSQREQSDDLETLFCKALLRMLQLYNTIVRLRHSHLTAKDCDLVVVHL